MLETEPITLKAKVQISKLTRCLTAAACIYRIVNLNTRRATWRSARGPFRIVDARSTSSRIGCRREGATYAIDFLADFLRAKVVLSLAPGLEAGAIFRARRAVHSGELGDKAMSEASMHRVIAGNVAKLPAAVKEGVRLYSTHSLRATTATLLLDRRPPRLARNLAHKGHHVLQNERLEVGD